MEKLNEWLKSKFKTINIGKLSLIVTLAAIIFAVVFGLITRNSYKTFDSYDEAIVETTDNEFTIDYISYKKVKKQLDKMSYAFVIEVQKAQLTYQSTKTFGTVKEVIKGDESYKGQNIAIYEPCFMSYYDQIQELYFRSMNGLSIPMQTGKTYLVFAEKIDYAPEYAQTLECDEFKVDWDYFMYSFPLETEIECITYKDGLTFGEIKNKSYICYTEQDAEKLEKIKNKVLKEYID